MPCVAQLCDPLSHLSSSAEDLDHPCLKDAEFVLEYIDKNVDFVIKPNINPAIMDQKLPPDIFFRGISAIGSELVVQVVHLLLV